MTEDMRTDTVDESTPKATMAECSHANPYTGETFGGELAVERMRDVDHEHPHEDADEANRVFARGHGREGDDAEDRTDSV